MAKLTAKTIESLLRAKQGGMTSDGDGLYFKVSQRGGASWIYRYKTAGRSRDMGLGTYPDTSLALARIKAADARKTRSSGVDPLALKQEEKRLAAETLERQKRAQITFETLTYDYLQTHGADWTDGWRTKWIRKMKRYAFPLLGTLPPSEITTAHVLDVLRPIWGKIPRTADETRRQIEHVLDAATARGMRQDRNAATWRGHLDKLLSTADKRRGRSTKHYTAMAWHQLPALMENLAHRTEPSAALLRLLILTAARLHMVRFSVWSEFDFEKALWALPSARMKTRRPFKIPLATQTVDLLNAMPRVEGLDYLFPGQGKSGVMHRNAARNLLHDMKHAGITRHGFRSSFRDWASEQTNYPREVCELALAHDDRSLTEAAYSRTDYLEKRKKLMQDWADFLSTTTLKL